MKVTGAGIEKAAVGIAILAGLGATVWIVKEIAGLAGAAKQGLSAAADAVGSSAFDLVHGDPNAQVQTKVQQAEAELRAAGSPPVGSADYNRIYSKYFP